MTRLHRLATTAVRRTIARAHAWRERVTLVRSLLRPGRRHKKVIVVGAGLAGLACAERLVRLGHQVLVIEARDRPGGRSRTVREPFQTGLHADAGGGRFHDWDARIWRYLRRFRLETEPFFPSSGRMVALLGGMRRDRLRGEPVDEWSPRELTHEERWIFGQESDANFSKVVAGIDRLSAAMAEPLTSHIRYGSEIVRIEHSAVGVRATALVRGERQSFDAEHLVCAIPFSVLRRIELAPAFSPSKRQIVDTLSYESAMQIFLQYGARPWEKSGLNGFAVTDTVGEIWHPTYSKAGPRAILVAYAKGDLARSLEAVPHEARVRAAVDAIDIVFPGTRQHMEAAVVTCWGEERWAGGAQAKFGDIPHATIPAMRAPEGRVHFAGEHLSERSQGWMEGAIESGYYAADEIDRS